MLRLLIITQKNATASELRKKLDGGAFACFFTNFDNNAEINMPEPLPDLVFLEVLGDHDTAGKAFLAGIKHKYSLPVIAVISDLLFSGSECCLEADDFVTVSAGAAETTLRARKLLQDKQKSNASGEIIRCGSLVIDIGNCDVAVNGKPVELTFKEYELLKLLAANKGRVFTREALLNKIWGFDYFGGDRTVDVHIRRLRSKIEDFGDIFIETVRNVGYRFTKTG